MMITLQISRGDIVLKAKDETYLSARTILAVEVSNKDGRYEMQADERATHERKLLSSIDVAVSALKAELNEYIITGDVNDQNDIIDFSLDIYDSFRSERKGSLKTLFQDYITKRVISEWWKANYPQMATQYDELAERSLSQLKRAFYYKGEAKPKKYGA